MFKALAIASVLIAAAIAPAVADDFNPRYAPQQQGGDWGGGQGGGWGRGPDAGWGGRRGDFGGPQRGGMLPSWQIARSLRYQGYFGADILNQRGNVTIVRAASRGGDFILVVDSFSGNVLRARPTGPSWNGANGWHGGWGSDWRRW